MFGSIHFLGTLKGISCTLNEGLEGSEVKVAKSCPALWDPMDYTVYGILQAEILEWVAFPFSRVSSQHRDQTQVSLIAGGFFTNWATRETPEYWSGKPFPSPGDLPDPGTKPGSPALQADFLSNELSGLSLGMNLLTWCPGASRVHSQVWHEILYLWIHSFFSLLLFFPGARPHRKNGRGAFRSWVRTGGRQVVLRCAVGEGVCTRL